MTFLVSGLTTTFFLVGARIAGMMLSAPMLSSTYIPWQLKVALTVLLTVALVPGVAVTGLAGHTVLIGLELVVQFGIGVLMGLVLALFLSIFSIAGQVITYQMGVGLAMAANPGLLSAGSFLSEWQTLLGLFVFVVSGGPELVVVGLHASFHAIPANAFAVPIPALGFVAGIFQTVLMIALLIAAPMITVGLVVNLSVGVLSRAFPQINAYFLSLPINFGLSLLVFMAVLPLLFSIMPDIWHRAWVDVSRLLVKLEGHP